MADIFVSHSKEDDQFKNLFARAFAGTKVKGIFEEFERILHGKVTASKIIKDIEYSNALFVILSKNTQELPHTRDWILWETGVAKSKDIWVFEPYTIPGEITVIVPNLRHYVIFGTSDDWLGYIRRIIESYDNSNTLFATLAGAALLGGLSRNPGGAAIGAFAGLALSDKSIHRPEGIGLNCPNCHSSYNVHFPQGMNLLRCPVCSNILKVGNPAL